MNINITVTISKSQTCFLVALIACAPHMAPGLAALFGLLGIAGGIYFDWKKS